MAKADLIEQQKADARNTLEEYCYKIRNEVEQDTVTYLLLFLYIVIFSSTSLPMKIGM